MSQKPAGAPVPSIHVRRATQQTTLAGPSLDGNQAVGMLAPTGALDDQSELQPGVFVTQVAPELPGELKYDVDDPASSGRSGYVYEGTWIRDPGEPGIKVAIKKLNDLGRQQRGKNERRLRRESTIWQRTTHPNIIPFYGTRMANGGRTPILVSKWCANGNLKEYLEKHSELSYGEKLRLLYQVACALQWLYTLENQIFHGDIKMENILILDDGNAALCDFGVSRIVHTMGEDWHTSSNPGGKGTKGFQSPEILHDDGEPSEPGDVYAFGGLILAVLSGKSPFHHMRNWNRVSFAVQAGERPTPEHHPSMLDPEFWWPFLSLCWDGEAEKRPTMKDIVDKLEEAMSQLGSP